MTLCVSITTADGLVMGTDSMTVVRLPEQSKHYTSADKLFEIPNLALAVMTYGNAAVGRRSIANLVEAWTENRLPYEKEGYTVEQVAHDLGEAVFASHRAFLETVKAETEERQREALVGGSSGGVNEKPYDPLDWTTGLVIGGYHPGSYFPWLYAWEDPTRPGYEGLRCVREHEGEDGGEGPEPGINYWGDTVALDRLYHGFDGGLMEGIKPLLAEGRGDELRDACERGKWKVLFEGMPIPHAVEMVRFMLEVGCGFERFKEGVPQIGGDLEVVVVTRNSTYWPHRKAMSSALSGMPKRTPSPIIAEPKKGAPAPE